MLLGAWHHWVEPVCGVIACGADREARVLTKREAVRVLREVRAHRWAWRKHNCMLWTWGQALYLEPRAKPTRWWRTAPTVANLHDRVAALFTAWLGVPCVYARHANRPGFHVFEHIDVLSALPWGSYHVDRQWERLDPRCLGPGERWDHRLGLSWTIPIAFGGDGRLGGLSIQEAGGRVLVAYEVGYLALHDGSEPHQIFPVPAPNGGRAPRITMQGHLAAIRGPPDGRVVRYLIYW